jgi:Thioesterase-like superfamily
MTDFATAMQLTPIGERRWSATVTADWGQGRTTFGGLLAALAARVAVQVVGAERPIRTMDVAFLAPIPPGPVEVDVELLGEGKAVSQLAVSLRSGGPLGVLGCRVHVVAGAARVSALRVDAAPSELLEGDPAGQGLDFPYLPGVMPEFCQHIEYRWCSEAFPFSGGGPETARLKGWARHRIPVQGVEATVALLDAWPPVVLPMTRRPTPASTVRWALHLADPNGFDLNGSEPNGFEPNGFDLNGVEPNGFGDEGDGLADEPIEGVADPSADAGSPWYWYEAQTVQCADGYASACAAMYSGGRLLAWSEQLIAIYDRPEPDTPAEPQAQSLQQ